MKSRCRTESNALVIPHPGQGIENKLINIHFALHKYKIVMIDKYEKVKIIFCFKSFTLLIISPLSVLRISYIKIKVN